MELDHVRLRTLCRIASLGSMTAAAQALGYTTGAVSQQMSALERAAGHQLLIRVGRNVQLTDAGVILAKHAERILDEQDAAKAALEDVDAGLAIEVTVGVFATAAAVLLPPALSAMVERFPQLEVRSIELDVDDASAAVGRGAVDLAFGIDYDAAPIPRAPDVHLQDLRTERFSIGHRRGLLPYRGAVALAALADQRWILPPEHSHYGLAIRLACRRAGFEPIVAHEVTDTAVTMAMASEGLGIAPVTDLMLRWRGEELQTVPLSTAVSRRIVLAQRAGSPRRLSVSTVAAELSVFVREQAS